MVYLILGTLNDVYSEGGRKGNSKKEFWGDFQGLHGMIGRGAGVKNSGNEAIVVNRWSLLYPSFLMAQILGAQMRNLRTHSTAPAPSQSKKA